MRTGAFQQVLVYPYSIYSQVYTPRNKLILFGAGPDARPLAFYAAEIGMAVTVCDWRELLCNKNYFPKAEQCIRGLSRRNFSKNSHPSE